MVLRSLVWSVLAVFWGATLADGGMPEKKPAEKGKPAQQVKTEKPAATKEAPRPKPIQGVPPGAIARALDQPVVMEFNNTPLSDVLTYVEDCGKIPIVADKKALEDAGIKPDAQVTMDVRGLTLRSALNLMLRQHDLTWTIRDEVLLITTPEQADAMLEARVYDVADLVAVRDEQLRPYNDFDQLIDTITSTVKPTTWDSVGGPGSIAPLEAAGITTLVVSQTQDALESVEKLLADLRKAKHPGADASPPVRERTKPKSVQAQPLMSSGQPQPPQPEPKPPAKPAGM